MLVRGPLAEKSYQFALNIIKVYRALTAQGKEVILARQLLRSGTSIGANVREAIGGQSRADFIAKLSIAYKEALETEYWVCLLRDSMILHTETAEILLRQNEEITRLISRSILTAKENRTSKAS